MISHHPMGCSLPRKGIGDWPPQQRAPAWQLNHHGVFMGFHGVFMGFSWGLNGVLMF